MSIGFTIIYEDGTDGWWTAVIPEVPGAISQGKTREEAREMVLDALRELNLARLESALQGRANAQTDHLELAS